LNKLTDNTDVKTCLPKDTLFSLSEQFKNTSDNLQNSRNKKVELYSRVHGDIEHYLEARFLIDPVLHRMRFFAPVGFS